MTLLEWAWLLIKLGFLCAWLSLMWIGKKKGGTDNFIC